MSILELRHIGKTYGEKENQVNALQDISLQVEEGEFAAIVGTSGSGKSTLLNLMGGLDNPTKGEIFIKNREIGSLSRKELTIFRRRNIGFVFQSFHLAKELTAAENVALPLGYAGVGGRERKERAKALLDRVGLSEKYKAHPTKLSGGEMQRVAIARALANHPQTLLADEPTGNLDYENGRAVMQLLRELNEEGTTVIMVTHDRELADLADRQICMADGNII